jgi:regulator of sigma E protease
VSGKVKASESVGSVISIGNAFSATWDWQHFWALTAIFSVILAFMNILPIPALDGGHALFCIYEIITGRKPTDKFMEYAQMVGMIILLALMAYALGLDIFRLFK